MSTVLVESQGSTMVLTLNRPEKRNAINGELTDNLLAALAASDADPTVRAVILTGAGSAFCAGMDLQAFSSGPKSDRAGSPYRWEGKKPIIAAVNGPAVAGGLELMLACDLAVAAEEARFGVPEVLRGLFPAGGAAWRLPRLIGTRIAMELLLTGELIDAKQALAFGLVNRVVQRDELLPAALAMATAVAKGAPLGILHALRLARRAFDLPEEELWQRNTAGWGVVANSRDAGEGARAFLEKRPPQWTQE